MPTFRTEQPDPPVAFGPQMSCGPTHRVRDLSFFEAWPCSAEGTRGGGIKTAEIFSLTLLVWLPDLAN